MQSGFCFDFVCFVVCLCFVWDQRPGPSDGWEKFPAASSVPSLGTSQKRSEVENPSDALVHFQGTTSMGFGKSQVGVT